MSKDPDLLAEAELIEVLETAFWDALRDYGSLDTDGALADDQRERDRLRPFLWELLERDGDPTRETRLGKLLWLGLQLEGVPADRHEYVIEDPDGETRADYYTVWRSEA